MHIQRERHQARRATLNQRLQPGLLIYPTARVQCRNYDNDFPFRYDSSFYYLTGFYEPEAVLVMQLGAEPQAILFCQPKNESREIWEGFLYGPEAACEVFGMDNAFAVDQLDSKLLELMAGNQRVYFPTGFDAQWDARVLSLACKAANRARGGVDTPIEFIDVRAAIDELRLFKDESEIGLMREAGRISSEAHIRAMQTARPGQFEYEVEAELLYHFMKQGSRSPAYGSIVASGANATCLHYSENNRRMQAGELLLIDAGCELHGYAADITRTFPVSGKFSGPQKDIYELVLAAMNASFEQVKPGTPRIAYHDASVRTLTQGLIDLKILSGTVDGLIEQEAYKQFYMHGTGHWLGLDVHDAGRYKINGEPRPLEAGMMLTVEPGLYFRPLLADSPASYVEVPAHFMHIGVRIEDDLLVTPTGHENLTALTPKTVAEIEATMAR
ncbi:aminopeptidase P N-terminal domain-containing protein [Chitinimonas sp. BJB300]|uniref:aminopeptidase P N-terminal domain-containing protein n=1 Tax=Chitinimonas sp. BJB300 TaxID=1559339 RepID=UPI000C121B70|nr:aminopeptidase P N-terminal domain-containing protein [Chitinimonas sp. BJB300]PHV12209.1 Xaa-Pro aminopeptidase [Chitinimonas sp. BJB300]TSJ91614.1 M24 family metallopeptidase [Chitinimonas sp. BJB300]